MSPVKSPLILLHERDNILIVRRFIAEGEVIEIDGQSLTATSSVDVGHKLARFVLKKGQKVIRFGAPIGSISADVALGEHVHTHNMQSDYIPSHDRQAVKLDEVEHD
jgi:hypothetical protein